jgi:hypothetical protein
MGPKNKILDPPVELPLVYSTLENTGSNRHPDISNVVVLISSSTYTVIKETTLSMSPLIKD